MSIDNKVQSLEHLRKKLLHLSKNRGCREMDIIFTKFADLFLVDMTELEMLDYKVILDLHDAEIMDYITKRSEVSGALRANRIMMKFLDFITI